MNTRGSTLIGFVWVVSILSGCGGNRAPASSAASPTDNGAANDSTGTGNAPTGSAAAPVVVASVHPDLCSAPDPGNNKRDLGTPIPLSAKVQGCVQTSDDVDYYVFATPAGPPSGGVVSVAVTDVSAGGQTESSVWSISDDDRIESSNGLSGDSVYTWFNAVPNAKYAVGIQHFTYSKEPLEYALTVTFTPVNDPFGSNHSRDKAAPIKLRAPVKSYLFAGSAGKASANDAPWTDWYKVTLTGPTVTVVLNDVPADITSSVSLHDALGTRVTGRSSPTSGGGVQFTQNGLTPGDYYVSVSPNVVPTTHGQKKFVPQYALQMYTLTVSP